MPGFPFKLLNRSYSRCSVLRIRIFVKVYADWRIFLKVAWIDGFADPYSSPS